MSSRVGRTTIAILIAASTVSACDGIRVEDPGAIAKRATVTEQDIADEYLTLEDLTEIDRDPPDYSSACFDLALVDGMPSEVVAVDSTYTGQGDGGVLKYSATVFSDVLVYADADTAQAAFDVLDDQAWSECIADQTGGDVSDLSADTWTELDLDYPAKSYHAETTALADDLDNAIIAELFVVQVDQALIVIQFAYSVQSEDYLSPREKAEAALITRVVERTAQD